MMSGDDGPELDEAMMRVDVTFANESVEFDVDDERLVGAWHGPAAVEETSVAKLVLDALDEPLDYPALWQAVVPGDRITIAIDAARIPSTPIILETVYGVLQGAGVERESIRVLITDWRTHAASASAALEMGAIRHDPGARKEIGYLATTSKGRRVYLNRDILDADFVLPIGSLGCEASVGYRGPWSVLFPGMSDAETQHAYAGMTPHTNGAPADRPALVESVEVSWLLGSQFQVGVLAGATGLAAVLAGRDVKVREEAMRLIDQSWAFRADRRADVVVAGVGSGGREAGIGEIVDALDTARSVVRQGGKIVVLSQARGPLGEAVQRLVGLEDPRHAQTALRGLEREEDYATAKRLAKTLAWADVYLLSELDPSDVEGLSMIALAKPSEARRLATAASSSIYLSQAEQIRASVADERD
jgi:nickel-dependent lactate racemase